MRRWTIAVLVAVTALCVAPASALAANTISGSVTDGANQPIAGISVTLQKGNADIPIKTTTTDANGQYTLTPDVDAVDYVVEFHGTGWSTQWFDGESSRATADHIDTTGGDQTNIDGQLSPAQSIAGIVTGPLGVTGVTVTAFGGTCGANGCATTVAANGSYTLGLPPGTYTLKAQSVPGQPIYLPQTSSPVALAAGKDATGVDFALAPGSTFSGAVTSAAGGPGVAGASVVLYTAAGTQTTIATTAADGTYTAGPVTPGTYRVQFTPSSPTLGFQFFSGAATLDTATPLTLPGGGTVTSVSAILGLAGAISGTVTDAATGQPLSRTTVEVLDVSGDVLGQGATSVDGTYAIGGLPAGSFRVQFVAPAASGDADQFYRGKATLAASDPVVVVAGESTAGISAALAPPAAPGPPAPGPPPTRTSHAKPPTAGDAQLIGLSGRHLRLSFTLSAGNGAPKLRSFQLTVPRGLTVAVRRHHAGIRVAHVKRVSARVHKRVLTVTLRQAAARVAVAIAPPALSVSRGFAGAPHSLTLNLAVADTSHHSTRLTLHLPKPR
jgi:hypothetical protein